MFGGRAVGMGREFVLLGGSAMRTVRFMHGVFSPKLYAVNLF